MSDTDNAKKREESGAKAAADLIRQKIKKIYQEPSAKGEAEEVRHHHGRPSKHQAYMKELIESGKSLADIQTAWHNYYLSLPDSEKHEVWNEFYAEHGTKVTARTEEPATQTVKKANEAVIHHIADRPVKPGNRTPTIAQIKRRLTSQAVQNRQRKLSNKQNFQSALFGMGMGSLVVLIMLFGFFNERFIAPFITPSKTVSNTPIIISDSTTSVDSTPKVIIPKINVEIPVVYDEPSIDEHAIQTALERGVVHYATTPDPGQKGNVVVFGHSSNNILNKGKYKFAFVLLKRLEVGDTFYLTKDHVQYAYRVYQKEIVKPTDVGVMGPKDKPSTATLITCDPPGTSLNRLIVVGEQISPDATRNIASKVNQSSIQSASIIPSNAPSLWQRIKDWFH
jgi:sortase A